MMQCVGVLHPSRWCKWVVVVVVVVVEEVVQNQDQARHPNHLGKSHNHEQLATTLLAKRDCQARRWVREEPMEGDKDCRASRADKAAVQE